MEIRSKSESETKVKEEITKLDQEEIGRYETDELISNSLDRKSDGKLVNSTEQDDIECTLTSKTSQTKEPIHQDGKTGEVAKLHFSIEERLIKPRTDREEEKDIDYDRHEKNQNVNENEESFHRESEITGSSSTIAKTKADSENTVDELNERISSESTVTVEKETGGGFSPVMLSNKDSVSCEERERIDDSVIQSKQNVKETDSGQCLNTVTYKRGDREFGRTTTSDVENTLPEVKTGDEEYPLRNTKMLDIPDSFKDLSEFGKGAISKNESSKLSNVIHQMEQCAKLQSDTQSEGLNLKKATHSSKEEFRLSTREHPVTNVEKITLKKSASLTSKSQFKTPDEFYKTFSFDSKFLPPKDKGEVITSKEIGIEHRKVTPNLTVSAKAVETFSDHFCNYCRLTSERYNVCEDCMIYFCNNCFQKYHPTDHTICKSKPFHSFACIEHKQISRYFCEVCKALRCEDCVVMKGKCSEHKIIKLLKHITQEKDKYDEAIHNFSTVSSQTINILSEELDKIEQNFTMTALQKKESLRQELASLRDLITAREQQMYKDLEQDCSLQLKRIKQRRREYGSFLTEDNKLLSKSLHTLGKKSLMSFYFSVQKLWERFEQHKRHLNSLKSPDELLVTPLDRPLSLYVEKKELDKSLHLENLASLNITCPSHTVYLHDVIRPLRVQDLVVIHEPTLSNSQSIFVEIRRPLRNVIWQSQCTADEFVVNSEGRIILEPKSRYIVKISLQTTTQLSEYRTTQSRGKPCHILLITGNDAPMDTGVESFYSQKNIVGLQHPGIFERQLIELTLFMLYGRSMKNPLDPIEYELMSFEERRFFCRCCEKSILKPRGKDFSYTPFSNPDSTSGTLPPPVIERSKNQCSKTRLIRKPIRRTRR